MRVGIDLTALLPRHVGIDRYLVNLLRHLGQLDTPVRFYVFVNREDRELVSGLVPTHFVVIPASLRPRWSRLLFQQVFLPVAALFLRLDVVHSPAFLMPLIRWTSRHVVTVHDLSTLMLPQFHTPMRRSRAFGAAIAHSVRKADRVCTPSSAVKADIGRLVPGADLSRVRVTPLGVSRAFCPQAATRASEVAARLHVQRPYILFVGTIEPRKNVALLLRAYRELLEAGEVMEDLVLAGGLGWGYEEVLRLLESPALQGRVHRVGYLEDEDLPALMAGARVFVFPSHQEGFGLPPLEAMACGTPTIVTDSSSLAENLHGAACLIAVDDQTALRDALRRVLGDEGLRAELRAAGIERAAQFRWSKTARTMLDLYLEVAGEPDGGTDGEPT